MSVHRNLALAEVCGLSTTRRFSSAQTASASPNPHLTLDCLRGKIFAHKFSLNYILHVSFAWF